MNIKELVFKGEDAPRLYACGVCGSVHSPKIYACRDDMAHEVARKAADDCCAARYCACGVELEKVRTACAACRERSKLNKAKIIDAQTYTGVVCANVTGELDEGYSSSISALLQSCEDCEEPVPAYCHPCNEHHLRLDPYNLLEQATGEMHDDACDQIVDADGLIAFLNEWNAKQTCISYYKDRSRVIILDNDRFLALTSPEESGVEIPGVEAAEQRKTINAYRAQARRLGGKVELLTGEEYQRRVIDNPEGQRS